MITKKLSPARQHLAREIARRRASSVWEIPSVSRRDSIILPKESGLPRSRARCWRAGESFLVLMIRYLDDRHE